MRILRFTIKDYGKGIEEKDYDKIFQPFRQTNTGLTNAEGGTGLGLAITKKLVEALSGQISVKSELGSWTLFTVDFPYTNAPVDIGDISMRLRTTQVLLIAPDPEEYQAKKAGEVFGKYSIDYAVFSTMQDAGRLLKEKPIDGATYVCLCQEDLYDKHTNEIIKRSHNSCLITYGPDFSVDRSPKHFRSLAETFPSVLARTIAQFVSQLSGDNKSIDASIRSIISLSTPWSSLKILIAEDNLVNQKVLKRILNRLEVTNITIVNNGEEAVKREAQEPFDLVLMDMQMPIMNGIEACTEISKREGGHPKAKIVFVTAHVADSFRQTCIETGAIGYLPKPLTKNSVKDVLKHAVGTRSSLGGSGRMSPPPKRKSKSTIKKKASNPFAGTVVSIQSVDEKEEDHQHSQ